MMNNNIVWCFGYYVYLFIVLQLCMVFYIVLSYNVVKEGKDVCSLGWCNMCIKVIEFMWNYFKCYGFVCFLYLFCN